MITSLNKSLGDYRALFSSHGYRFWKCLCLFVAIAGEKEDANHDSLLPVWTQDSSDDDDQLLGSHWRTRTRNHLLVAIKTVIVATHSCLRLTSRSSFSVDSFSQTSEPPFHTNKGETTLEAISSIRLRLLSRLKEVFLRDASDSLLFTCRGMYELSSYPNA